MATRCYLPETEAADVSPTISTSDWGHIPGTPTRRRLRQRAADASTLTTTAVTPDAADHSVDANSHHRQYVSDPLCAQTISGTLTAQFQTLEAHANNNLQLTIGVWLVSRDGTTLRSVLLAPTRKGTEPTTSLRNTTFAAENLTSRTAVDGDRLVIEIGLGGTSAGGSGIQGHNGSIRFGGTAAGGDLAANETEAGTTFRPWVEFSGTISFGVTGDTASYAVTGTDVILKATLRFAVDGGAYAVTGASLGLSHGVPSDPGAYALTGTEVTLTYAPVAGGNFPLAVDGAAYGFTGSAAGLLVGGRVDAALDGYALTGTEADLRAGWRVPASGDTYALTGSDATLIYTPLGAAAFDLAVEGAAYGLGGSDAGLVTGWHVTAAPEAYALTGEAVGNLAARRLDVGGDEYLLEGSDADLDSASGFFLVNAGEGLYQWWGDETVLAPNPGIQLESGDYAVAGRDTGPFRRGETIMMRRRRRG